MEIDFGKTSDDYANFRIDFAPELFERLRRMHVGIAGQRVLDLGAGTGLLARGFSRLGCDVTLIDRSAALLRHASDSASIVASAEHLPLITESFDIVAVAQCWH